MNFNPSDYGLPSLEELNNKMLSPQELPPMMRAIVCTEQQKLAAALSRTLEVIEHRIPISRMRLTMIASPMTDPRFRPSRDVTLEELQTIERMLETIRTNLQNIEAILPSRIDPTGPYPGIPAPLPMPPMNTAVEQKK